MISKQANTLLNREQTQGRKVTKCFIAHIRFIFAQLFHKVSVIEKLSKFKIRFLSPESEVPYFKLGANPIGKCFATSALLVDSEVDAFKPLIELLQVEFYLFL